MYELRGAGGLAAYSCVAYVHVGSASNDPDYEGSAGLTKGACRAAAKSLLHVISPVGRREARVPNIRKTNEYMETE